MFKKKLYSNILLEAPVSWKTIQKAFLPKYGAERLEIIAKANKFNNFKEFYDDVYETLYKDEGGRKYEPPFMELNKIFKFLLEDKTLYHNIKLGLWNYGYLRYFGENDLFDKLIQIKTKEEFEKFFYELQTRKLGDLKIGQQGYSKVYSDSNIDIYKVDQHEEMCEQLSAGTTWCVRKKSWFERYSRLDSIFYVIVSKKEWFEQKKGIRKKYALRVNKNFYTKEVIDFVKSYTNVYDLFKKSNFFKKLYPIVIETTSSFTDEELLEIYYYFAELITPPPPQKNSPKLLKEIIDFLGYNITFSKFVYLEGNKLKHYFLFNGNQEDINISIENADKLKNIRDKLQNMINIVNNVNEALKSNGSDALFEAFLQEKMLKYVKRRFFNAKDVNRKTVENYLLNFNIVPKNFFGVSNSTRSYEFTNNNQNVRYITNKRLPDPYHSMLKHFDVYNHVVRSNEIYTEIDSIANKFFMPAVENEEDEEVKLVNNEFIDLLLENKETLKNLCFGTIKNKIEDILIKPFSVIIKKIDEVLNPENERKHDIVYFDNLSVIKMDTLEDYMYYVGTNPRPPSNQEFSDYCFYLIQEKDSNAQGVFKYFKEHKEAEVLNKLEETNDFLINNELFNTIIKYDGSKPISIDKIRNLFSDKFSNIDVRKFDHNKVSWPWSTELTGLLKTFIETYPENISDFDNVINRYDYFDPDDLNELYDLLNFLKRIKDDADDFLEHFNYIRKTNPKKLKYQDFSYLMYTYVLNLYSDSSNLLVKMLSSPQHLNIEDMYNIILTIPPHHLSSLKKFEIPNFFEIGLIESKYVDFFWKTLKNSNLKFIKMYNKILNDFKLIAENFVYIKHIIFKYDDDFEINTDSNFVNKYFEELDGNDDNFVVISIPHRNVTFTEDDEKKLESLFSFLYHLYEHKRDVYDIIYDFESIINQFEDAEEEEPEEEEEEDFNEDEDEDEEEEDENDENEEE